MTDEELIWASALRYALGRRTYIIYVICNWFKTHKLSNILMECTIKDIEQHEKDDDLGDICDKIAWLDLKEYLQNRLKVDSDAKNTTT